MKKYNIAIVLSQYNPEISDYLLKGALESYNKIGSSENISVYKVPGAFEIPGTVNQIIKNNIDFDAIVTLGSIIKGETAHFDYISSSVTNSLSLLSKESKIPVIFGILTTFNYEQGLERSDPSKKNKGGEVMDAAISTIETYHKISH